MKVFEILIARLARYWPFANGSGRLLDMLSRSVDLGGGERIARLRLVGYPKAPAGSVGVGQPPGRLSMQHNSIDQFLALSFRRENHIDK